jgi:hypothetical protein
MSRPAHHSIVTLSLNDLSGSKHLAQSLIVDKKLEASGIKAWDIWKRTPSQVPPLRQSLMSSPPLRRQYRGCSRKCVPLPLQLGHTDGDT